MSKSNAKRILHTLTTGKKCISLWSMPNAHKCQYISTPLAARYRCWNLDDSLVYSNYRTISTTFIHNSPLALKQKSNSDDNNKKTSDRKPNIKIEKQESQSNVDTKGSEKTENSNQDDVVPPEKEEKLSMTARFRKMYKEYWYVLLPVHIVTSSCWFGGFYYLSTRYMNI